MYFSLYSFDYKQVDEFAKAKQKLLCPANFTIYSSIKFHYYKNDKLHIGLTWHFEVRRLI